METNTAARILIVFIPHVVPHRMFTNFFFVVVVGKTCSRDCYGGAVNVAETRLHEATMCRFPRSLAATAIRHYTCRLLPRSQSMQLVRHRPRPIVSSHVPSLSHLPRVSSPLSCLPLPPSPRETDEDAPPTRRILPAQYEVSNLRRSKIHVP